MPRLAEAKRVSWANLLFAVGSLIGIWTISGILPGAGDSLEAIKGASWGGGALTFVFTVPVSTTDRLTRRPLARASSMARPEEPKMPATTQDSSIGDSADHVTWVIRFRTRQGSLVPG